MVRRSPAMTEMLKMKNAYRGRMTVAVTLHVKTNVGAPQLHVIGGRDMQNNSRRSRRTTKEEDSRGRETLSMQSAIPSVSSSPMMIPMLTNLRTRPFQKSTLSAGCSAHGLERMLARCGTNHGFSSVQGSRAGCGRRGNHTEGARAFLARRADCENAPLTNFKRLLR